MTVLKNMTVKIRKQQQCYSCFRKFRPGTIMNYWVGVNDDFYAVYSCLTCVEIMNMSSEVEFEDGFVSEMLNKGETPEDMIERWKIVDKL